MYSKFLQAIELMRKSYSQPLILHKLYKHIRLIIGSNFLPVECKDFWHKVIFFGAVTGTSRSIINQGLEMKLLKALKVIKHADINEKILKTIIICYYLNNRPTELINHLLLFDLVMNFMGINDFIDSLIIKLLQKIITANVFYNRTNKKMSICSINKMVEIINKMDKLSEENRISFLPCTINQQEITFPVNPIQTVSVNQSLMNVTYLEAMFFFLKYHKDPSIFSDDLQPLEVFVLPLLKEFSSYNIQIDFSETTSNLLTTSSSNSTLFLQIEIAFNNSNNKEKFVNDIQEYLYELLNNFNN